MSVPLPAYFGKYQLLSHLAEGGMADVYLGRLVGPGGFEKRLVVKVIRPELAQRREFCEMFVVEAKITVALSHGNIVPVYELGVVDGQYFLAMELVDGPTVHQLLFADPARGGAVPPPLSAYIAEQVLRGLDYAHRNGVVHRDLSSANVMCSRDGEVKIVDFGIAAHFQAQAPRMRGGSQGYMAPEQERSEAPDARSDLFAVGVLLGELCAGRRFAKLPRGQALCAPPFSLPPPLAEIIETATAETKEARFADAAAMMTPLSRFLREGDPPTQADLSRLVRKRSPDERRLGKGTPGRILALITHAEEQVQSHVETAHSDGAKSPQTTPILRGRPGTEDGTEDGDGLQKVRSPDFDFSKSVPLPPAAQADAAPPSGPEEPAAPVPKDPEPPSIPHAGEAEGLIRLPPPGGTVIFASRPARTHATWRTYALAAIGFALLGTGATLLRARLALPQGGPLSPTTSGGILNIKLPAEATLFVNEERRSASGPLPLSPGRHRIRAQAPGRRPQDLIVEVRAGETLHERLHLPWVVGNLQLESDPPAAVTLDGESLGTTPLSLDVPMDRAASLRLVSKGYVPLLREILPSHWVAASPAARLGTPEETEGRQPQMRLQLRLLPLGKGLLTVGATPWAQVFVDGERRGDTPLRRLPLSAGSHTLRLYCPRPSCPEPQELRQTFTLEPGREARRIVDFQKNPVEIKE